MTFKEAIQLIGGLSRPSKMPCFGYSTPAVKCKMGTLLRKIKNSVCSGCYAMKGRYIFPNVQAAMSRRFDSLNHPRWVEAMTIALEKRVKNGFFRWHDSGDIQSVEHLKNIIKVALNLPHIKFWLPTREKAILEAYAKQGSFPRNLTVRLSANSMEQRLSPAMLKSLGVVGSSVSSGKYNCPAPSQDNFCLDCRKCWNKKIMNITYKKH